MNNIKVGIMGNTSFVGKQLRHVMSMNNVEFRLYDPADHAYSFGLLDLLYHSDVIYLTAPYTYLMHCEYIKVLMSKMPEHRAGEPIFVICNPLIGDTTITHPFVLSMMETRKIVSQAFNPLEEFIDTKNVVMAVGRKRLAWIMTLFYESILDKPTITVGGQIV